MKGRRGLFAGVLVLLLAIPIWSYGKQKDEKTVPYVVRHSGFLINIPKSWKVEKGKYSDKLTIPIQKSAPANLFMDNMDFRAASDRWQEAQATVEKQFKRKLVRQWEDDIAGIPLLLTESTGTVKGVDTTFLTGLYFSASTAKLHFRLDVASSDYTSVSDTLFSVLSSLATTDGTPATVDDPNKPLTALQKLPKPTRPPITISVGKESKVKLFVAPTHFSDSVSGRTVQVGLPEPWTAAKTADDKWTLTNGKEKVEVLISLASTLDSDDPTTALLTVSGRSLNSFNTVASRNESVVKANLAGAGTDSIWREGNGKAGKIESLEFAATSGAFYLIGSISAGSPLTQAQKAAVDDLLQKISITVEGD